MLRKMARILVLFLALAAACLADFRAGAAKRKITPDLGAGPVYLAGFNQNRAATGIHDDLWVRCVAMSAGRTLVICGVDSIGLFFEDVQKIREGAAAKLSAPADIVVAATHNHETPDTMGLWGPGLGKSGINEQYNALIVERAVEAVVAAAGSMRPATARLAKVRNAELDGFVDDTRPPVVLDTELTVLALDGRRGGRIATLVNWANHPEVLGSKNTLITADYLASFYTRVEKRDGGTAVFVNGAVGGMMSPLGAKTAAPEESFQKADLIGSRVAELACDAIKKAKRSAIDRIEHGERMVEIPVTNKLYLMAANAGVFKGRKPMQNGGTRTPAGFFRLWAAGRPVLECATVPGELYPELSMGGVEHYAGADYPDAPAEPAIKQQMMRAPFRMLIGLANDEIGYVIPRAEWDEKEPWLKGAPRRYYGEINSVGPDAAPAITNALSELLGGQGGRIAR